MPDISEFYVKEEAAEIIVQPYRLSAEALEIPENSTRPKTAAKKFDDKQKAGEKAAKDQGRGSPPHENESIAAAKAKADAIVREAKAEAQNVIFSAQMSIKELKEKAAQEGYEDGKKEGYINSYHECTEKFSREYEEIIAELKNAIEKVEEEKKAYLERYSAELRDIAVSVAEKVIQVSLKSSGEIIKRMILSATEKVKSKEWAKIYIAKCNASTMIEGDADFLRKLAHISEHINIILMESGNPGACIIEFPDEIIDASANTQVENIKEILNNAGV